MFDLAELYVFLWLIYLVLSFIIFKKDSRWINRIFVLMTLNLSFESLINAWFTIHKNNFQGKLIFVILSGLDIIFYFNMLIFIILLTDNENWFNRLWKKIAISIPMIIAIYIYEILIVDPLQFAKAVSGKYLFENIYNGYIYNSYFYLYYAAIGIISICLVFRWYRKESVKRKKRQALIVFISMISALVMGILLDNYIEFFTETHVDPLMVIITVIPCLAVAYSMKKYRMMNVDPKNMAMEIAQLMSEGIIVINHEGIVQYANNGIGTMLGFKNKDMVDKHISYIIEKNNEELKLKDINSEEIQIKTRDNKIIPVLFSSTIGYDEFDEILSIVLIFKNISEIKKIQNEIVEINNDLEKRVEERTNKLNETNEKLNSEILRRIDIEKDIAYIADHDYLTGLPNRRYLMNKFNEMVKLDGNLAIVYMDIDMFKNINDSLGHEIGDRVLIEVGNRLNMIIKKPNIIARIGGDEFLILINDFQNREGLSKILDEILQLFNESFELEREKMIISSSLGIAIYPEDGKDFGTLMKNADISLYSAKADGKARYKICNEDLKQQIKEEYKLINYLKNALEMEEIAAYYQPKVNQCTGKIVGFEALARWNNSEYGFISPVKFIPIAEKTGLIIDIGEYMLKTACEKMKGWVELGHTEWVMSVNISVVQIRKDRFVERIKSIVDSVGLEYKNLELEVTESLLIKNNDYILSKLVEIKKMGIKISMDDFGTEYSSLSYLKYLPVNKIKIAREFVSQININKKDEAIIRLTLNLIKEFGFEVIAEGVETLEQAEFLRNLGCEEIQGYYFYKPMSEKQLDLMIKKFNDN